MRKIKNRLKEIRKEKKITQTELAKKAGISRNTVIKIESGKSVNLTLQTILKIAEALETEITDIFIG